MITINDCLSEKNKALFDNLKEKHKKEIILRLKPELAEGEWQIEYKGPNDDVYINTYANIANESAFTHELLHLKLYQEGFDNNLSCLSDFGTFSFVDFDGEFYGRILNNIAHKKMFPLFLKMGYQDVDFVLNATYNNQVNYIHQTNDGKLLKNQFLNFIANYISAKYSIFPAYQDLAEKDLNHLRTLNNVLFQILEDNCNNWDAQEGFDNRAVIQQLLVQLDKYIISDVKYF